jgi:serine/threonine-protein kinase
MGIVYKAQQVQLKRLVALKMIKGSQATPEDLARFRAEAEAVARLRHANIVQIYDIGEHDDRPFFCLEFVEGGSLAAKVGGKPVPGRLAAQLVETLARTMHYAHQHGIVHRDLKPANVLLTGGPDTPLAQCIPKITDFGLAKQLDADTGQTRSGAILGTPSYMAPEQAAGWIKQVGPLADVYALGAILYELLTGRPPFREATVLDTLDRVRRQEPTPPSQLQRRVPRDLETICLKCLEKEPLRRYSSAQALADDLQAFLRGEPITARPQTRLERLLRWRRQHPAAALLGAISLIALVALVVGIWWHNALAFSAAAVISLVVGGGWFYYRLQEALLRLDQQHLLAQRQLERLHLLLEMTQRLIGAPDLDSLLRLISETTTRLANAERATIFLIDHQKQELWSKVAMGDGIQEIRIPLGVGIAGAVADSGETINLADPYADPRFNREVDRQTGYRTRNLLAIPMRGQNGRIIGVFQVLNKLGGPFLPDDVEPLSALAASAALALENAQRFNSERVL